MIQLPYLLAFFESYGIGGYLLSLSVAPTLGGAQGFPSSVDQQISVPGFLRPGPNSHEARV